MQAGHRLIIALGAKQKLHCKKGLNKLPLAERVRILSMLAEGPAMRSVSRVADVSINAVSALLVEAGNDWAAHHEGAVPNLKARGVQSDEIWSFCYAKQKAVALAKAAREGAGEVWTWSAIEADAKLMISDLVGARDAGYATEFMQGVTDRLATRALLTTDGHKAYLSAVEGAFGIDVGYAMLSRVYGDAPRPAVRSSTADCTDFIKRTIDGHGAKKAVFH